MLHFKDFLLIKENSENWRKSYINLENGFIPPTNMKPIIHAFNNSGKITLTKDTSKSPTMPKKSLFLVGGPVRDFLLNKTIKDFDLATNATPEQIAHILSAANFKMANDRSGKNGKELDLTFKPKMAQAGDKKIWFIKGRDASKNNKPFVISAVVHGQEFEIATFRLDAKITDGAAEVDFVDNPHDDASRRDLTINSMYIELTKADGENNRLYDPTGKGYHDVKNNEVRTVGKAEDRFSEDKLRVMRAIRFHCRFNRSVKMNDEIEKALPRFKNLNGVALERIRDEFIKGLLHPDVDTTCYLKIYIRTGIIDKIFPNLQISNPNELPPDFADKKDKILALAWLLQNNSVTEVNAVLSPMRQTDNELKMTGWTTQERKAITFLLKLKEFSADGLPAFIRDREGTGLTAEQIQDWVNICCHNQPNPRWSKQVNKFSDYKKSVNWNDVVKNNHHLCPRCQGQGCNDCIQGEIHPSKRANVINRLEIDKFNSYS